MPDADALALSDRELLKRTRAGDRDAYGELWRRHAASGRTVARSYSSLDADDVVAESFMRIYQALLGGRGPRDAFRPYLFATIRNTAAGWGRERRESPLDALDAMPDPASCDESWTVALDGSVAAEAFRALPPRWQEILWYTEVEGMSPQDAALLIGRSANSTSALAYRAREGLRQAWITAHLRTVRGRPECEWTVGRLGTWVRGRLGVREVRRLEGHLDGCTDCTLAAAEARATGSRLALALLPLVAGSGAATAYADWLRRGEDAVDAVVAGAPPSVVFEAGPMPDVIAASAGAAAGAKGAHVAGGAHAAGAGSAGGAGVLGSITGVFLGIFIAATTVAATLNLPTPDRPPAVTTEAAPEASDPFATQPPETAHPEPQPETDPAPDAGARPPTARDVDPAPRTETPADEDTPEASTDPAPPAAVEPAPEPPAAPEPQPEPTRPPGASLVPPTVAPEPDRPAAPRIHAADTGGGLVDPLMSGSADPGARVQLHAAGRAWETVADGSGEWNTVLDELGAGSHTIEVRQIDATETASDATIVQIGIADAPTLILDASGREWVLRVSGHPGAAALLTLGERSVTLALDDAGLAEFRGRPWGSVFGARFAPPLLSGATVRHIWDDRTGPASTAILWGPRATAVE